MKSENILKKEEFLAVGEACVAIFCAAPGIKHVFRQFWICRRGVDGIGLRYK